MRNLKAIWASILLFVLFCPLIMFVGIQLRQVFIREAMMERLERESQHTVKLEKLIWYKKNKELLIEGRLFDVKSISKCEDGKYLVKGLYDEEETELKEQIRHAGNSMLSNHLIAGIFTLTYVESFTELDPGLPLFFLTEKNPRYIFSICSPYHRVIDPPPIGIVG